MNLEKLRDEMVRDRVEELLSGKLSGQENCNPYDHHNMGEFLAEIESGWVKRICELCTDSKYGTSHERDYKEKLIGTLLMDYAEQFWREMAEDKAEEDTPTIEELDEDFKAEASDARREEG